MSLTIGSLCSGAGGLDLAVADVLGDVRTAWVAETDPEASRVLAARFEAPNLGDITAVDWRHVEPVDVITAGFPCQDISNAGHRAGIDGAKSGVWRHVATAIGVLRPRLVLLENVAALLVRGGTRVVGDLAACGYVGSWRTLRASDVGAPHQRNRVFIVAADPDREPIRVQHEPVGTRVAAAVAGGDRPGAVTLLPTPAAWEATRSGPHARYGNGTPQLSQVVTTLLPTPTDRGSAGRGMPSAAVAGQRYASGRRMLDDGHNNRGEPLLPTVVAYADRWAQYAPAIARWEAVLGRPAPEPTVLGKRGGRRLSARFVEWLLGWPEGWVTDLVDNTAALRLCGNGVVPQQGAAAYRLLGVAHA